MALTEPVALYTAEQSRAVDHCAITGHELPGTLLMARAARAAFRELLRRWPSPSLVQVLVGPGNNGGDGLLLALLADGRGIPTRIVLVDGEPRSDDAQRAMQRVRAAGLQVESFTPEALLAGGVLVDAMLGTGIEGPPRVAYATAIDAVNARGLPVLALDVPSGLNADTGACGAQVVRAAVTVSFITGKRGLYTGLGPDCAGERVLDDLEVPAAAYAAAGKTVELLRLEQVRGLLPPLAPSTHKGHLGRCLLIGGERGMGGAVLLAAEAALRCGVGLLRVATREEHVGPLLTRTPEAMATAVRGYSELEALLPWADTLIVGPGLGQEPWGEQMLSAALASGKPMLLDADALNLLAGHGSGDVSWTLPPDCIITPHPGEAARLLGVDPAVVQADRFAAGDALLAHGPGAVILKGHGSLVVTPDSTAICASGNPGMASGGMGDVLSGIAGALLAQGLTPAAAARLGCALHGEAADLAARERGQRTLLASDLAPRLGALLS